MLKLSNELNKKIIIEIIHIPKNTQQPIAPKKRVIYKKKIKNNI
jgi:hypothetical protein